MHTFHYLSRCYSLMPRRLDTPKDADAAQNVEAGLIFARTRTPLYVPLEEARAREPANGANTIPDTFTTQGFCLPLAFFFCPLWLLQLPEASTWLPQHAAAAPASFASRQLGGLLVFPFDCLRSPFPILLQPPLVNR